MQVIEPRQFAKLYMSFYLIQYLSSVISHENTAQFMRLFVGSFYLPTL